VRSIASVRSSRTSVANAANATSDAAAAAIGTAGLGRGRLGRAPIQPRYADRWAVRFVDVWVVVILSPLPCERHRVSRLHRYRVTSRDDGHRWSSRRSRASSLMKHVDYDPGVIQPDAACIRQLFAVNSLYARRAPHSTTDRVSSTNSEMRRAATMPFRRFRPGTTRPFGWS